ncbi:MAG: TPM domain-containing protein [Aquabacterium sp.]
MAPSRPPQAAHATQHGAWAWCARLLLTIGLLLAGAATARAELAVPALTGRVIDTTGTLDAVQRSALEGKLEAFEREAGPQIVVLMLATTDGEDIAAYAQRVADQWKIGRRDVGDGLLVVVAKNDRRMRIEVAKALEGAVPDLAARQIIERHMAPPFKKGDYAGGLHAAVDALKARVAGEHLPAPGRTAQQGSAGFGDSWFSWALAASIALFIAPVIGRSAGAMLGRGGGALAAGLGGAALGWWWGIGLMLSVAAGLGAFVFALVSGGVGRLARAGRDSGPVIFGGGGGGGWSGGGSSGGGFSSGGGGDFGGGGASGDW